MEIKEPSCSSNNQEYESQICRSLDHADKCQRFDIATAIHEARIDFRFPPDDPCPDNDGNDDGISENPEEPEDPFVELYSKYIMIMHCTIKLPIKEGNGIAKHDQFVAVAFQ
jgi:hypothetical protein